MKRNGPDRRSLLFQDTSSPPLTPTQAGGNPRQVSKDTAAKTELKKSLRSVESSPAFPTNQDSFVQETVEFERAASAPSLVSATRREDIQVPPETLASLHALNESFLASRYPSDEVDDISRKQLASAWGAAGSWQIWGDTPSACEAPMSTRRLAFNPSDQGENAEGMLRRYGAAAVNTKGTKGDSIAPGQDNFSISRLPNGWEVFCMFDGHGEQGHWPAERAALTMPYFLQNRFCSAHLNRDKPQVPEAMTHAFKKVQADMVFQSEKHGGSLLLSGCTAVCAMKRSRPARPSTGSTFSKAATSTSRSSSSLWLAVCGDSRAALIVPGQGLVRATVDHKPDLPSERRRIEKSGGEVITKEWPDGFREDRVYIRGARYPGLQMSRSLGDLVVKAHGVIAEPEIYEWSLEGYTDPLLVVATDGVWELMDNREVADIILQALGRGASLEEASTHLLESARQRWAATEDMYCDDISLVIIPMGASAPAGNWDLLQANAPRRTVGQVVCRCLRSLVGRHDSS